MKTDPQESADLEELVSLLLEGGISRSQFAQLQLLLAGDSDALWYYVKRIDMVGSIGWALHSDATLKAPDETPDLLDLLDELPAIAPSNASTRVVAKPRRPARRSSGSRILDKLTKVAQATTYRLMAAGLTAAVLLIAATVVYQAVMGPPPVAEGTPEVVEAVMQDAATLVETADCQWVVDGAVPSVGDSFQTGHTISLDSGIAEFVFESGARIILQGHSTLRFDSPSQASLTLGTLTANVPEEAIGFSVEAGKMKVIDLGTEFGVAVTPSGAVQAEVFTGQVSVRTRKEVADTWEDSQILGVEDVLSVNAQGVVASQPIVDTDYMRRMPGALERVAIRNPSFEQPVLPYGDTEDSEGNKGNHGTAEGWKVVKRAKSNSTNSCLRPIANDFNSDLPHGRQVGYTNQSEILSQVLSEVCEPNTEYQLSAWVGWRIAEKKSASKKPATCTIKLLAGETVIAEADGNPANGLSSGDWKEVTFKVTTPSEAPYIGQPLAIRFRAGSKSVQVNYDAVDLVKQNIQMLNSKDR